MLETMKDFSAPTTLGRTGLRVGRIGMGASYDAPARAYDEAFERGLGYFYWGSRRRSAMAETIQREAARARDRLVVVIQSYSRFGRPMRMSFERALRQLGLDHADVLLLGWYNSPPPERVLHAALELRERGLARFIALSSHHRPLFPALLGSDVYDVFHCRYNAVHRGAEREVFPRMVAAESAVRPGLVTFTTTRWGHLCDPRRMPPGERVPTGADCHRFVLSHPAVNVSLAGPGSVAEMRDVLGALDAGPMSEEELAWMRRVGDHVYGRDPTTALRDGV